MWFVLFAQATTGIAGAPGASQTATNSWWEKGLTFLIGAIGGWISGTVKVRGQRRVAIDGLVLKLIELAMEYPYLERDSYCAAWKQDGEDSDERARYENYCCLVFNTIENAWELNWHLSWNKYLQHNSIRRILQVEELICRHHQWWEGDADNIDGYASGFRSYILFVVDKSKREKKL